MQRNVVRPVVSAAPKTSPVDCVPASTPSTRIGTLRRAHDGRRDRRRTFAHRGRIRFFAVMSGFTKFLQGHRRSRLHAVHLAARRLYWLAGHRSATENWDAFEAPRGDRFLTAPPTSDWRQLHSALSSLATELDASAHEYRDTQFTRAQVWRRADGQLVLLDFSWPAPDASQTLNPVELLAAVSTRAFAPTTEPAAPLSGTTLLHRLASEAPPALADVKAELLRLHRFPAVPHASVVPCRW